jgi:hypothetical protein
MRDETKAMAGEDVRTKGRKLSIEAVQAAARAREARRRLASATGIDSEDLLDRLDRLGLTAATWRVLDLIPAVETAWAEGVVTRREREVLWRVAASAGVEPGGDAGAVLAGMLQSQPDVLFFEDAREALVAWLDRLSDAEREARTAAVLEGCRDVAQASGGLRFAVGAGDGISDYERRVLEAITHQLRPSFSQWQAVP